MAAETTPQHAGEGIIILGRVVGGVTGLVASGIGGIVCLWLVFICGPIFAIPGAIFGAVWGGRTAHDLDPMGDGAPRAVCRFAAGVLGGVVGGIGAAIVVSIVGVIGLIALVAGIAALVWLWWIWVPLGVLWFIALAIRGRVRSPRRASEGDASERAAQVRWPMDQWGDWT